jgi:DNA-binding NarL/FixJ family response regulator
VSSPYRVLLADDHRMIRQGIRRIIEERPELQVVGEAGNGAELLDLIKRFRPNLILMDISMPGISGIEATKTIKAAYPRTKILMLTMYHDKDLLRQAMANGADGYILKEEAESALFKAIETLQEGATYVSPLLSDPDKAGSPGMEPGEGNNHGEELTGRQREIVKLICEGKTSKEIAELLYISFRTAENHRTNIMRKLGFKKNIDLVKYAIRRGYINIPE